MNSIITTERIDAYCLSLLADERSAGTISKYRRDLTAFARWLDGRTVTKAVSYTHLDVYKRQPVYFDNTYEDE